MKELFLQAWFLQAIAIFVVQTVVFANVQKLNVARFATMTLVYLIPFVGAVFVLLVASQAFRSVPDSWGGSTSVFSQLADGYEK